jgi:hypothetical protein
LGPSCPKQMRDENIFPKSFPTKTNGSPVLSFWAGFGRFLGTATDMACAFRYGVCLSF